MRVRTRRFDEAQQAPPRVVSAISSPELAARRCSCRRRWQWSWPGPGGERQTRRLRIRDEGNCARATERGEEACEEVRKRRVCLSSAVLRIIGHHRLSPPGPLLVKAARLRTETSSKAGSARRVSPSSQSRTQTADQVNDGLVQPSILSIGDIIWYTDFLKTLKLIQGTYTPLHYAHDGRTPNG